MNTTSDKSEKNNASSSGPATSSFSDAAVVIEEDLKDVPTPLRRRAPDTADDHSNDKGANNRRRFKFASFTGRSRPSFIMRLAKMASSSQSFL